MPKKLFALNILLLCLALNGRAQDSIPGGHCYYYEPTGEVINGVDTVYTLHCKAHAGEQFTPAKLHLKVGSQEGLSDILDLDLELGGHHPEGMGIEALGDGRLHAWVGGIIAGYYRFDVRLEDAQGNVSEKLGHARGVCR